MIDAFIDTLEIIPRGLVFVGLGLVVLVIAKFLGYSIVRGEQP